MSPLRFIFLGAPGVGKGTFASLIGARLGLACVGAGDLLRSETKDGTVLGKEIGRYVDRGELVPDSLVIEKIQERLREKDAANGFIIDGFPRTLRQAEALEQMTSIDRVMDIALPRHFAVEKMLGRRVCQVCGAGFNVAHVVTDGFDMPAILPDFDRCSRGAACPREVHQRSDDNPEVILQRIKSYEAQVAPLQSFYEQKGLLHKFNVRRGIADTDDLMTAMLEDLWQPDAAHIHPY